MKNNDEFLPSGYEAPSGNGMYMKILKGENKVRILSKPILGWLDWKDKQPLRFRMDAKPKAPVNPEQKIKHFWAFVVFDYADSGIKVMEITQSTIQSSIQSLAKDSDWGSPFGYDIKINRTGEGMETNYTINPVPHKVVSEEIKKAYFDKPVNLEAVYDGGDPFAVTKAESLLKDEASPF